MAQETFKANEPLESLIDSKHEIFTARSPVDIVDPVKAKPAPLSRGKFGRLADIAYSRIQPLVKSRETLNKVYAQGYFENHYPEADRSLKGLLHDQAMQAWANSENPSSEILQNASEGKGLGYDFPSTTHNHTHSTNHSDSSDRRVISLHFNLGK